MYAKKGLLTVAYPITLSSAQRVSKGLPGDVGHQADGMLERTEIGKHLGVVTQPKENLQLFQLLADLQEQLRLVTARVGAHDQLKDTTSTIAQISTERVPFDTLALLATQDKLVVGAEVAPPRYASFGRYSG